MADAVSMQLAMTPNPGMGRELPDLGRMHAVVVRTTCPTKAMDGLYKRLDHLVPLTYTYDSIETRQDRVLGFFYPRSQVPHAS